MKKLLLIISLIISIGVFAQTQPKDLIFPVESGDLIFNCKIISILDGNTISFHLNGQDSILKAKAIVKNGVFIDLSSFCDSIIKKDSKGFVDSIQNLSYQGKSYSKYFNNYHRNLVIRNIGLGISAGALTSIGVGLYLVYLGQSSSDYIGYSGRDIAGMGLIIFGAISASVGIPFFIVGQIVSSTNKGYIKGVR